MEQPAKERRALVGRRTPVANREKQLQRKQKLQQKQAGGDEKQTATDDVRSVTSTATSHVAGRLASLLEAPADGSAFMSLSKKITLEEKALQAAPKMRAKRRSRLEIVAEDDDIDFDEVHHNFDSDEDGEDGEAHSDDDDAKHTKKQKKHTIVDIVESSKAKKVAAKLSKKQQQQQDAADEKDDAGGDEGAKSGMKLLKAAVRDQNHLRVLPHQERSDYEYRLRRIATSGAVRLFNALAHAQSASKAVERTGLVDDDSGIATSDKIEHKKVSASREAFMTALRGAASSKAAKS